MWFRPGGGFRGRVFKFILSTFCFYFFVVRLLFALKCALHLCFASVFCYCVLQRLIHNCCFAIVAISQVQELLTVAKAQEVPTVVKAQEVLTVVRAQEVLTVVRAQGVLIVVKAQEVLTDEKPKKP